MSGGLFGSVVLDVAIGLAFIYLLLAIFCTAANEWLAGVFKTRGKFLAKGIAEMLNGQAGTHAGAANAATGLLADFYAHPLVSGMMRDRSHPSYLPARTFATVLLDLVTPGKPGALSLADVQAGLKSLPDGEVKRALLALTQNVEGDLGTAQKRIEGWYDDVMDRVSGWYKRRTQVWTILVALLLTIAVNADTLHIAWRLWTDPTLRSQVVEEAKVRAAKPRPSVTVEYKDPNDPLKPTASGAGEGDRVAERERALLGQMIGWSSATLRGNDGIDWLGRVIGWILTAIAVSLGAPFWFDILNRFMNIRSSGRSPDEAAKKPEKKKLPPEDHSA
jgi:hypothetical protein